jgi:hypothetical protein
MLSRAWEYRSRFKQCIKMKGGYSALLVPCAGVREGLAEVRPSGPPTRGRRSLRGVASLRTEGVWKYRLWECLRGFSEEERYIRHKPISNLLYWTISYDG